MTDEIWVTTAQSAKYEVSNLGRVRNKRIGKILNPSKHLPNPYLRVSLGWGITLYLHRVVLESFAGPPPEGMQCAHIDGDGANNRLDNLCWKTPKQNGQDKVTHGTAARGEKNGAWAGPHCKQGHAFDAENTILRRRSGKTVRICRECNKRYFRMYRKIRKLGHGEPEKSVNG